MISVLRYGNDSSLPFELPGDAPLARCDAPRGQPLVNVAAAVDRALADPLAFPPLVQAALPGDKVVLALDHGVPQAATIVARTVATLLSAGVTASDITLVRTMADVDALTPDPLGELAADVRRAITCTVHDPSHRESLSYLAATTHAQPIYVNRAIHDADLVIPIGCLRVADSLGYYGINANVFPAFSDAASIERYRSPKSTALAEHNKLCKQADEVGWLLGVQFTMQVVPAAGGGILHVLAGEIDAVLHEGSRLCEDAWSYRVPHRASLVVATIVGDASQQTWENVARALAAASRAVRDEGSIALCTDLAEPLGPGLQRIVGADDLDAVLHDIDRQRPADALPASELVHALRRGNVYLVSRLEDELVEDLGMLPIAADQIARLAGRYDSCIVLTNAHYARVREADERPSDQAAGRKSRR